MKIKKLNKAAKAAASTIQAKAGKTITSAKQETKSTSAPKTGVNIGRTTGLRVMAFQDETLRQNDLAVRRAPLSGPGRRTDEELAAEWRGEFPESRAVKNGRITAEIVRGVRSLYNNGTGGHGTEGQKQNSRPYVLQGKDRVVAEYTRARKEKEEPKAAPAQTKTVKAAHPKKVVKPVVVKGKSKAA